MSVAEREPTLPADTPAAAMGRRSGCCRQFGLLLGKFWKVKRGQWKVTLLELLVPIYPVAFLAFMMGISIVPSEVVRVPATASPAAANLTDGASMAPWLVAGGTSTLGFAPSDAASRAHAAATCEILYGAPADGADACGGAQFFADEAALVAAGSDDYSESPVAAGVVFTPTGGINIVHTDLELAALVMVEMGWTWPATTAEATAPPQVEDAAVASGLLLLQAAATEALLGCADSTPPLPEACPFSTGGFDSLASSGSLELSRTPEQARIELSNYLTIVFPMMLAGCLFMSLQASMTQVRKEREREREPQNDQHRQPR
jgi:hypothetical protein